MKAQALFSKKSDDWSTPRWLLDELTAEFHFDFDPCPLRGHNMGLFDEWKGNVFCNPPYSNIENFLNKALLELKKGNTKLVVFLIPVRSDTKWFHKYLWDRQTRSPRHGITFDFINKRLKFGESKEPSALLLNDRRNAPRMRPKTKLTGV
jgi:site-specific DNA-methyltransferase (adenine-specific)